jgi:hypothetical protein
VDLSPELDLLLACARAELHGASSELPARLSNAAVDWNRFVRLCLAHSMLPLVARVTGRHPADLPAAARSAFSRAQIPIAARTALLTEELARILQALAGAGIPVLAYKGPALAVQAYGSTQARAFQDLDLLVRPADFPRARSVLLAAGYVRSAAAISIPAAVLRRSECDESLRHGVHGFLVELHWAVTPPYFGVRFDVQALFDRSVEVAVGSAAARAPGVEDLLVLLAVNGTKEAWTRLETLVAFAALMRAHPALDWSLILELAARVRARRMVHIALLLCQELLCVPPPAPITSSWPASPAVIAAAGEAIARFGRELSLGGIWLRGLPSIVRAHERIQDRVQFCLLRAITPTSKDAEFVRLPAPLWPGYYLVRPLRLLYRGLGGGGPQA